MRKIRGNGFSFGGRDMILFRNLILLGVWVNETGLRDIRL